MGKQKPDNKSETLWSARPDSECGLPAGTKLRAAPDKPDSDRSRVFTAPPVTDDLLSKILT